MSKIYTPEEVAKAVLKHCKDMMDKSKLVKKEHDDKEEDEKLIEEKIKEHEGKCKKCDKEKCECKKEVEKCGDIKKSSKLKDFLDKKKKKTDLKKLMPANSGISGSVASTGGPSIASQIGMGKQEKVKKCGTMNKEEGQTSKAVGLKPITSDKIKAPSSDQMPEKPKAATTLKGFMEKRKK